MKILFIKVLPCDVGESVDVTSKSGITGMNGLVSEFSLDGLNFLNGLWSELAQEHTLSQYEF